MLILAVTQCRPERKVRKTTEKRRADPKRRTHFDECVLIVSRMAHVYTHNCTLCAMQTHATAHYAAYVPEARRLAALAYAAVRQGLADVTEAYCLVCVDLLLLDSRGSHSVS